MQTIDQAFEELRSLHQQLNHSPVPEIGPQAFLPFPPGQDPVSFAIEEVAQLKRLVENLRQGRPNTPPAWVPPASVYANESTLVITVELAGVRREDVSVTAVSGQLVVQGQRRPPVPDGELQPMFVEQAWGPFERCFALPAWCDPDRIEANYDQGVLEIRASRSAEGSGPFQVKIS